MPAYYSSLSFAARHAVLRSVTALAILSPCCGFTLGEKIRIDVGDVGKRKTRKTFVIPKLFPQSDLIVVRGRPSQPVSLCTFPCHSQPAPTPCVLLLRPLPQIQHARPIGIVAVPDTDGRLRVAELIDGSWSAQAAAIARLNQKGLEAAAPGDVLRAFTSTVFEFEARCAA